MTPRHCYLFTLEIDPLVVGRAYDELPLHCTLATRFWVALEPKVLANHVLDLFDTAPPLVLAVSERALIGPQYNMPVGLILPPKELADLNIQLHGRLLELGAEYVVPQWGGKGHIFHITDRADAQFVVGDKHTSSTAYLIEVKIPGHEHQRIVREKFKLQGEPD